MGYLWGRDMAQKLYLTSISNFKFSLGFVGKFPSEDEVVDLMLDKDIPVFMCVLEEKPSSAAYKKYLSDTVTFFKTSL